MARQWFIIRGDAREGPLTAAQLRERAASNLLHADDLLIADDLQAPVTASRLKGLIPPAPSPITTNAAGDQRDRLVRMRLHLRICLGLAVGGMLAVFTGMWLMPRWDGVGPYPPIHPLLVIGSLCVYLPVVYLPIVAWKTTELLGWPPARRIRYTLSSVIPHIGIVPNLALLAATTTDIQSMPAAPRELRPPSPLATYGRRTAADAGRWARDHIVASLLIAAGLGAVGRYAAGRIFFNPRQADTATARAGGNVPAETREAAAIRRVLHEIRAAQAVALQAESFPTFVGRLSKIPRADCPADFRAAYVDLLSALRRGQHADETRRAFESQPRDAIIVEGFLRGALGDPFGKAHELSVEAKRTAATLAAATQELDAAFSRLSDIALGYGVDFQDAQR